MTYRKVLSTGNQKLSINIEILGAALIQAYKDLRAQGLGIADGFTRKFPERLVQTQFNV